jgi:hypothetical protein
VDSFSAGTSALGPGTAPPSHLRPDNFQFFFVDQQFLGDWNAKEKWYETKYKLDKFLKNLCKISGPPHRLQSQRNPLGFTYQL